MTEVSKDGPIQFERDGYWYHVETRAFTGHGMPTASQAATPADLLAAIEANPHLTAIVAAGWGADIERREAALTTARSEHEAIVQGLRRQVEVGQADLMKFRKVTESVRGQPHGVENYSRLWEAINGLVGMPQSIPAAESAKVAEGKEPWDLMSEPGFPELSDYIQQHPGANAGSVIKNALRLLRDRDAEREALRNALTQLMVSGSFEAGTAGWRTAIKQAEDALRSQPSPTREAKDSSPSPGVPVAAADSGAARPRETVDTVFAATDNPGDGAGATSATGEAKPAECSMCGGGDLCYPDCPTRFTPQPAQKAAFVVGPCGVYNDGEHHWTVPGAVDRCVCGAQKAKVTDPAPAAEVPVTVSMLVAALRVIDGQACYGYASQLFGRLANELAKRKEG